MKHNKKRNTAFLYEALVQELTKSVVEKDNNKKSHIVKILKEHFSKGKVLYKELSLYKSINETRDMERKLAEKIIYEARMDYSYLPEDDIFNEQSRVINKINKNVSSSVFSNFVKNYKDLASISQIFNGELPVKQRVLLEETLLDSMCSKSQQVQQEMKPLDQLTYNTFIKKFNEKYGNSLLKEQKELLTNYLTSFSDNGLSLKIYLNEELERVKDKVKECLELKEIKQDEMMTRNTNKILKKLDTFRQKEFDQQMLGELLKIQHFTSEAQGNGE
jgi:hypothetical protein